jgi:hypothetical protein
VVISPGGVGRRVVADYGPTLDLIVCVGSAGAEVRDGEVAGGAVRADQAGLAGRGIIDPGAGRPTSCAPAHGAAGAGQRGAAAAEGVSGAAQAGAESFTQVIDEWLMADRDVPRKQRHAARRI